MSTVFTTAVRRSIVVSSVLLISVMTVLAASALAATLSVRSSHHVIGMLWIEPDGQGHTPAVTRALSGRICTKQLAEAASTLSRRGLGAIRKSARHSASD